MQKQITIGDILGEYGDSYISRNHIKGGQKGLIHLLTACHTSLIGSHYEKCDNCDYLGKAYNSCRNRHCPTCQQKDKLEWLNKRMQELLPVGYYHLVFTIPHELNPLCLKNKKALYNILFNAATQTLLELSRDTRHLGACTGLIAILHTWGQNMMEHPHVHCIMPAGGLSFDKVHWVHTNKKDDFFIHYKVLSGKFRGKFLDLLKQAYCKGELEFKGPLASISGKVKFAGFTDKLYRKEWVVNIQKPFGKPGKVLEYLSRYVFRIAITDRRIIEVKDGKVRFSWKDYRTGLYRIMNLDTDEFIRRFLLHVLPKGFFKVRYYGIFASRYRKENIELAKKYLQQEVIDRDEEALEDGRYVWEKQDTVWNEIMEWIRKYRQPNCPQCKKGRLRFAGLVPRDQWGPG
jgi:hypothetical protein